MTIRDYGWEGHVHMCVHRCSLLFVGMFIGVGVWSRNES